MTNRAFCTSLVALLYLLVSRKSLVETKDLENNRDLGNKSNRTGRWSYFTRVVEHACAAKCKEFGKPFGHLIGTRCYCLCPINASDWNLCDPAGSGTGTSCVPFCQDIGYFKGGLCLNSNCFCTSALFQEYDPSVVYTTPAPS